MKGPWLWVGIVGAALALGLLLVPSGDEYRGVPASSLSAGPAGSKALYRFLGAMGLEVERWQGHDYQGLPDGTLWVLSRDPIPSLRLGSLEQFLGRGNTVIGPFAAVRPLLEREGIAGIEESLRLREVWRSTGEKLVSDGAHELNGGPEPDAVFAGTEADGGEPVIARWLAGKGAVVVLGADDIVRNELIGEGENGPLLLELAQHAGRDEVQASGVTAAVVPRQIFDEVSTGVATKTWGQLLSDLPYRYGLGQAGLALLVLLIAWLPRRLPIDRTPALSRRTTAEHLDAVARFWKLGKDPGLPLSELVLAASERAARRGGSGPKPFVDWVAKLRPDLAARADVAFSRAEALSIGIPKARAARAAAVDLMQLEREASQW